MSTQERNDDRFICGFEDEWRDFRNRNSLFLERLPNLVESLTTAFYLPTSFTDRDDMFVFPYGRVCVEDFFEVLLLCGNGYGYGAEKLIRGLYKRALNTNFFFTPHPRPKNFFFFFFF